jgi:transcriptional regulator with XRE-family HTH domain
VVADRILSRLTQLPGARSLWERFPVGSIDTRVRYGIFERPHYAYGVYSAADLARRLGIPTISVIELGVAGGRGLLALERLAGAIGAYLGVEIRVAGFDSGKGMPPPSDYRDLAHVWGQGFYQMDVSKLKARLSPDTELILGDVADTIPAWNPKGKIGFVAFDLDYYSSTKTAFRLFQGKDAETRLPRTYCYFDDLRWPEHACHNEYIGELCAIQEFNAEHEHQKICPIHMLRYTRIHQEPWNEQMYVLHDFRHPLYCKNVTPAGEAYIQIPLR